MGKRTDTLARSDALIHRKYFQEMLDLYGIASMYFQVRKETAHYNEAGEFSAFYHDPIFCRILFDQVPKISTLKKLGWTSELDSTQPLVHVDYDLPELQVGACFAVEDPMRPGKSRLFRITKMSMGIIYPASVTCQLVAVLGDIPENTLQPDTAVKRNKDMGKTITRPEGYD